MTAFRDSPAAQAAAPAERVFVGKGPERNALVTLSDAQGRARLRLTVDSLGDGRIEFLDASGRVVNRYPPTSR